MRKTVVAAIAVASTMLAAGTAPAGAEVRVKVGLLTCEIVGGVGFVVGSTRDLSCRYEPASKKPGELYQGTISRFGIDLGAVKSTHLVWAVLAPTGAIGPGALAGSYVGASAEATVGVGIGANALIGGFGNSIALNPLSIQTQTGANLAAGVAGLTLIAR